MLGIKSDDQSGMTLLEVLLAIVLLFIVLSTFAGFFSQSAIFIKKNEEILTISQTAQHIVNLLEVNATKNELASNECVNLPCILKNERLSALVESPVPSLYDISAEFKRGVEGLIQVKVTVTDPNHPESSSETFTYLRR